MNPGYEAAKYELVMISDSGIRMKEDTLVDMVQHMTDNIALVHQMPFTADREGFAATFEKVIVYCNIYLVHWLKFFHYNLIDLFRNHPVAYLPLGWFSGHQLSHRHVHADTTRCTSAVRRHQSVWLLLSGRLFFSQINNRFRIQNVHQQSVSHKTYDNPFDKTKSLFEILIFYFRPAWQNSGLCDITSFQARLIRWAKLRMAMVPHTILLEPMSECMIVGALASWSVNILFHWDPLPFYLVHILIWFLSDWILLSVVQVSFP